MITTIKSIKKKIDKNNNFYYVVYFDYFGFTSFTYLTKKSLEYWKKYRGLNTLAVGQEINVFQVRGTKNFRIVDIKQGALK